jgi:hypothetical protein
LILVLGRIVVLATVATAFFAANETLGKVMPPHTLLETTMPRRLILPSAATVLFCFVCFSSEADDKGKQSKSDPTEELLSKLFDQDVHFEADVKIHSLKKLLNDLSKQHQIAFEFDAGEVDKEKEEELEKNPIVMETRFRRLSLHQFLEQALNRFSRTYKIKGNVVQIVYAPELQITEELSPPTSRWVPIEAGDYQFDPVTSVIVRRKPLREAVELIATRYELNVTFASQANNASKESISARLMNIPAGRSLEMLAMQCGLCVVRKNANFLITTPEHVREMAEDELKTERRNFEMAKLRDIVNNGFLDPTQVLQNPEPSPKPDSQKKENEKK